MDVAKLYFSLGWPVMIQSFFSHGKGWLTRNASVLKYSLYRYNFVFEVTKIPNNPRLDHIQIKSVRHRKTSKP